MAQCFRKGSGLGGLERSRVLLSERKEKAEKQVKNSSCKKSGYF